MIVGVPSVRPIPLPKLSDSVESMISTPTGLELVIADPTVFVMDELFRVRLIVDEPKSIFTAEPPPASAPSIVTLLRKSWLFASIVAPCTRPPELLADISVKSLSSAISSVISVFTKIGSSEHIC